MGSHYNAKDWKDIKIHFLTFIRPTSERRSSAVLWEALCDCGNITYVIPSVATRKKGPIKSCGCYKITSSSINNRTYDPIISSARKIWRHTYMDGNITFDDFYRLSQLPCYYCGDVPYNEYNISQVDKTSDYQRIHGKFIYNGLDRIDNAKGHTLDNVVTCCKRCNWMKNNTPQKEFILHIHKMYNHMVFNHPSS